MATDQPTTPTRSDQPMPQRSLAEWITFTVATLLLVGLVGLILYDGYINQSG
jgi:hypothetical protein